MVIAKRTASEGLFEITEVQLKEHRNEQGAGTKLGSAEPAQGTLG
jgi:hypothetical protein